MWYGHSTAIDSLGGGCTGRRHVVESIRLLICTCSTWHLHSSHFAEHSLCRAVTLQSSHIRAHTMHHQAMLVCSKHMTGYSSCKPAALQARLQQQCLLRCDADAACDQSAGNNETFTAFTASDTQPRQQLQHRACYGRVAVLCITHHYAR